MNVHVGQHCIIGLACFSIFLAGCTVDELGKTPISIDTDTALPKASEIVTVEIDGQELRLNGFALTLPVLRAEIEEVLGVADRGTDEFDGTITWDDLGLFGRVTEGKVHELVFVFQEHRLQLGFYPKHCFAGSLSMCGVSLNANSQWNEVERAGLKQTLGIWEHRSTFTERGIDGKMIYLGFANPY